MTYRSRFIGAIAAVNALTIGVAFFSVVHFVNENQERQLEEALYREAVEEAAEVAEQGGNLLRIDPKLGPAPDDVGELTQYAVLYDQTGKILDRTPTWTLPPPALASLSEGFMDIEFHEVRLHAYLVEVPNHPGVRLLLAARRTDLDEDAASLRRWMGLAFALALLTTVLLTSGVVRRLTHVHQRIAEVAGRVAADDLSARVGAVSGDREIVALAKNVDDMVARLEVLLRAQQRFIANAAHELRSPLTALYGVLSQALRRVRDNEAYRESIAEALESAKQLRVLTEDLLALARLGHRDEQRPEPIDLTLAVRESVAALQTQADAAGVTVAVDCEPLPVLGRKLDLLRMVRNLVENAIRHAPRGSVVQVQGRRRAGRAELVVADEGPGVAPDDVERIFQPFFRGARDRSESVGAGLGLAICREIASTHQGALELRPSVRGACFVFTMPLAEGGSTVLS